MSLRPTTMNENARSALDCGGSSYRFPPWVHASNVQGKAVAAATAVQSACGTAAAEKRTAQQTHRSQACPIPAEREYLHATSAPAAVAGATQNIAKPVIQIAGESS